jgi:hypothetical protein
MMMMMMMLMMMIMMMMVMMNDDYYDESDDDQINTQPSTCVKPTGFLYFSHWLVRTVLIRINVRLRVEM